MNIKKTTKYSLLAIGVLTTFQLGQVKASADSFENSNESLIKNQDENQPALNTTVSIPEAETRVVTEPNSEEKLAVDQGDKKYPAPALTEKETKSSEEDAKNTSTEASSSDKDSKAETTLNKDSEGEASPGKDSKTDPTLNSVEKKEDPTLAPDKLSNASTNEAETAATPAPKIRRKRAAASNTKVYDDADYGKYVKATDFGLDTTGKVEASEAIKKALPTTNDEPGLMELMNRADAAKYQAESAKADIEKVTSPEDLAKARKAANDAADAFIRDIDEALKVAKKKQQTDTLKELVTQAESAKADAEKAKKAIPGITSTTALNDLTKYLKGARDEFRKVRATIDTVPNAQNKSSDNSKVKTIIAVLLGVLGLGAIAAAIVQFAGPALKAFGINLPGL